MEEDGGPGGSGGGWDLAGQWNRLTDAAKKQVDLAGKAFDAVEVQDVKELRRRIEFLEAGMRECTEAAGDADKINAFLSNVGRMDAEILTVKREYERREKALRKSARSTIVSLRNEVSAYKDQIAQKDVEAVEVVERLVAEKEGLENRATSLQGHISQLETTIERRDSELLELRRKQIEATTSSLQESLSELQIEKEDERLQPDGSKLIDYSPENGIAKVNVTGPKMQGTHEEDAQIESPMLEEVTTLKEALEDATRKLRDQKAECAKLQAELTSSQKQIRIQSREHEEDDIKAGSAAAYMEKDLKTRIATLSAELESSNDAYLASEAKVATAYEELASEKEKLASSVFTMKTMEEALNAERNRGMDTKSRFLEVEEQRRAERAAAEAELSELSAQLKRARREVNQLKAELAGAKSELETSETAKQEMESASSRVRELEAENGVLTARIRELESSVAGFLSRCEDLEKQLGTVKAKYESEAEETKNAAAELEQLLDLERGNSRASEKGKETATAHLKELEEQVFELQSENSKLEAKLKGVQRELRRVTAQTEQALEMPSATPVSLHGTRDMNTRMLDLTDENAVLKEELARLNVLLVDALKDREVVGGLASI
ncbi:hypothetical protein NDN08_001654 [Rhodosorus marinus]|uniref:TATA element modulatory factor 1 TATA binding domain-containing protein n=1 Tax=Rhodosorus marinus TaxID=101924 RepID=A0AAV8URK8_9RHOD|nr:hypothetical protein NDN08_001654 [Rhodosorus marinus]